MVDSLSRRRFLAISGLSALAGCVGGATDRSTPADPSALPLDEFSVPLPYTLSDLFDEAIVTSADPANPPEVGRFDPAIDEPVFVTPEEAPVTENEVVFGVELNGETKAYPQSILVWHEIVNDVVGGDPVAITYCPLTGTAIGFERGGTTLGLSNKLVNSNLILYDRATSTWWPQMLGAGIAGEHRGKALVEVEVVWTTWGRWRAEHPETTVLSEDTGFVRDYDDDPYGSYDPPSGYYATADPTRVVMHEDDRFHPKEVVVGARTSDGPIAFRKDVMREGKVATESVGAVPYTAFYDDRLDAVSVYRNPDGDSFSYERGGYVGSDGGRHRADAIPLERVNAFDAMWFAWFAYFPNTSVFD